MTATATKTRVGLENKAAIDAIVWTSNVLTSVFIVFVNKFLMDPKRGYGYVFATTLCSFHFFASGLAVRITEMLGYSAPAKLPRRGKVSQCSSEQSGWLRPRWAFVLCSCSGAAFLVGRRDEHIDAESFPAGQLCGVLSGAPVFMNLSHVTAPCYAQCLAQGSHQFGQI